jgi:hypothetical protein
LPPVLTFLPMNQILYGLGLQTAKIVPPFNQNHRQNRRALGRQPNTGRFEPFDMKPLCDLFRGADNPNLALSHSGSSMARSSLSRRKRKGLNGRKPSQRFHLCQRHKTVLKVFVVAAAMVVALAGQSFEVASIRPHTAPLHNIMGRTISGPRVTFEGYTIPQLIIEAYSLKGIWQLSLAAVPGQSELLNVYYDIAARAPGETAITKDESRKMLQTLLPTAFT